MQSSEVVRVQGQSGQLRPGPPSSQQLQVHRYHLGGDPMEEALAEEAVLAAGVDAQVQRAAAGQETTERLDLVVAGDSDVPSGIGINPVLIEDERHGPGGHRHEVRQQVHVCEPRWQHKSEAGGDGRYSSPKRHGGGYRGG